MAKIPSLGVFMVIFIDFVVIDRAFKFLQVLMLYMMFIDVIFSV